MPRQVWLDAPGTLHHVMVRGIEKRKIVDNRNDQNTFVERMEQSALDTDTKQDRTGDRRIVFDN